MRDEDLQRRGEAFGFRRPVGEERRRCNDEARPALAFAVAERQKQRQHLDGLA
jgi:hypothetical protein